MSTKLTLATIGIVGLILASALAADTPAPPATTQPAAQALPADGSQLAAIVTEVRNAKDLATAVNAFVRGQAYDSRSVALHEAYVQRMIEFGYARLAETQARTLVGLDPGNSLGWAVLAFNSAERGDIAKAFSEIAVAVQLGGCDDLVQKTAGQLLAWYDRNDGRPATTVVKTTADSLRKDLGQTEAFQTGYEKTLAAMKARAEALANAANGIQNHANGAAPTAAGGATVAGAGPVRPYPRAGGPVVLAQTLPPSVLSNPNPPPVQVPPPNMTLPQYNNYYAPRNVGNTGLDTYYTWPSFGFGISRIVP